MYNENSQDTQEFKPVNLLKTKKAKNDKKRVRRAARAIKRNY